MLGSVPLTLAESSGITQPAPRLLSRLEPTVRISLLLISSLLVTAYGCDSDPMPTDGGRPTDSGSAVDAFVPDDDAGGEVDAGPGESCSDGLRNQDESDIDCGGVCPGCDEGDACGAPSDCAMGECMGGVCDASVDWGITNIEVVSEAHMLRSGQRCYEISCPAGKQVLSGGFHYTSTVTNPHDGVSRPITDTTWEVCSSASIGDETETIVYAVCGNVASHTVEFVDTVFPGSTSGMRHVVDVPCTSGEPTIVGYGRQGGSSGSNSNGAPYAAHLVGGMARAAYQPPPVGRDYSGRTYAVCAANALPNIVREMTSAAPGAPGCATARCPAGQVMVGGGHEFFSATDSTEWSDTNRLAANRPDGMDGWYVCYSNNTVTDAQVTAKVHCIDAP